MKSNTIITLVKKELFTLCLSTSMYVSSLFFLFATSIYFFYFNTFFVIDLGSSDLRYYFEFIPLSAILVVPSLSMSLWTKNDADSTLPVSSLYMVIAKWIATVIVFSFYFFVSLSFVVVVALFGNIELEIFISSILGILLFALSVCAFGQLCALVFKSGAASFFLTSLILAIFSLNGYIAQVNFNNTLSSVAKIFSFSWNFQPFSRGIIDSRSVFFFIITTVVFLGSSQFYLEHKKYGKKVLNNNKTLLKRIFISGFVFLCLLLINSQIFYQRIDITQNKRFSLSEYSQKIIEELDSPLRISYYLSNNLKESYPHIRDIEDFLYEYSNESSNVSVQIIEPNSESIKSLLKSLGVIEQTIPSIIESRSSVIQAYSAIIFEYKNKTEVIPFILDTTTLEFEIAGRLQSLTDSFFRSAFILIGNDLSLQFDYPLVVPILENSGYTIRELSLHEILQVSSLDTKSPLIILGSSSLTEEHVQAINSYITIGGKVFIAASPIDIDLDTWTAEYSFSSDGGLFSMLENYGINIDAALIHDVRGLETQLQSNSGETTQMLYPFFIDVSMQQKNNESILGSSFKGLSLLWPTPITVTNTSQIAHTSSNSWLQQPNSILYEQTGQSFITNPFFDENTTIDNNTKNEYTIAATHSNSLVVVSDQYFLSRGLSYINQAFIFRNFDFLINSLLFLQENYELIILKNKSNFDYTLTKIDDDSQFLFTKNYSMSFLFVWYLIATFIPYFCVKIIRRRNKKVFFSENTYE